MRLGLRGIRKLRVAAWFGLLALCIQAYIPVHLAGDIAHALEDRLAGDEWLLDVPQPTSDVAMHDHGDPSHSGGHSHPSHRNCPLFLAAPGASAFVLPASVEVRHTEIPVVLAVTTFAEPVLRTACPASYASRAPPVMV